MTINQKTKSVTHKVKQELANQENEEYVLGVAGNNLWVLSRELPNGLGQTVEVNESDTTLSIDWYSDKNKVLTQILTDFNHLENGDFGGADKKSFSGWEIASESAHVGIDLSDEWRLSGSHTAFLLAPEEAARPSLSIKRKIPIIDNAPYRFSGFFATHRSGGVVTIDFFDKNDDNIGKELIDVLYDPKYIGGHSLKSYNQVDLQFTPIKGTHYIRFKIELGKQVNTSETNACLFFTKLFLGLDSNNDFKKYHPVTPGMLAMSSLILSNNWFKYGVINLGATRNDEISIKYNGVYQKINLLDERKSIIAEEFNLKSEKIRLLIEKKLFRKAKNECLVALQSSFFVEQKKIFNELLSEIKNQKIINIKITNKTFHIINESGLFDEDYYAKNNDDLDENKVNLLEHFVLYGWAENRDPNRFFSIQWYSKRYNIEKKENPLLHFIQVGWMQAFDTSKDFCTLKYLQKYKAEMSEYVNPLAYFINIGKQLGHKTFKVPFSDGVIKVAQKNARCPVPDDLWLYESFQTKPEYNLKTTTFFNQKELNIHWIIPDFSAGSGGHMTIFRMINYLERFGHQNTIWITGQYHNQTIESAYETIVKKFQFVSADVKFFNAAFYNVEGDAVIATGWNTVWGALGSSRIKRAFYFVQDYEPSFYAAGSRAIVAEETYRQDIDCICASPWLAKIMTEKYGRWAKSFLLSYDSKSYFPNKNEKEGTGKIEISAYYRPFTDRRAVELVLMGLDKLASQLTNFRVHFFGNHEPISFDAPFEYIDHGVLSADQLGELYRSCDVGVTFSATNYSLIPQEMMACGLPVVELDTECCRTVFPKDTITLAKPHPLSISESIIRLLTDKELVAKQVQAALDWISQFSWETAAKTVESSIIERLEYLDFKTKKKTVLKRKKPEVSVVIPTYNGGERFKSVLQRVLAQQMPWEFEVIVIDSSSSDGTAEFLQTQEGVTVHNLAKSEFQHGRTRNLGAEMAQGDFIAFITQDALPASEYWLYYLIASLKKYPNAGGVFGKHLPYEDASPFVQRDLPAHFKGFDQGAICVSKFLDSKRYEEGDQGWHQFLRFYSDNNSAMRKAVWEQIPYPEINFGEDQAWAKAIIDAGYEKVYSQHGLVYHSHNYEYKEQFIRAYEEYAFFKEEFGLLIDTINAEILCDEIDALNHRDIMYSKSGTVAITEEELQLQLSLNKGFVLGKHAVYLSDSYGGLEDKRLLLESMISN